IRGFRIEPAEIEAVLTSHPDVTHAAVIIREDRPGEKQLIAYTVGTSDQLQRYAASRLPAYMVPTTVVALDALPLTVNGKLDRKALPLPPTPSHTNGTNALTPTNAREQILCEVFADVLGLETVHIDDGFFDLGGDSIASIQLVSRARRAGLTLTTRDVFERRTVRELAAVATDTHTQSPTAQDGAGEVPTTPIIEWFRTGGGPVREFNQSYTVPVPADLTLTDLTTAFRALVDHHDALRMRLHHNPGTSNWDLTIPPAGATDPSTWIRRVDTAGLTPARTHEKLTHETTTARSRLDPENGVMAQLVWFDAGPDHDGQLLIVIHHLVVDGVSWRILLPDLATAHRAASTGRPITLEPVHTPFRQWAKALNRAATEEHWTSQLPYWQAMAAAPHGSLGATELDPVRDTLGTALSVPLALSSDVTEKLLTVVPTAYRAGMNDVLLTALTLALR
ncbi:condensation domain-containing protein, partial [Streptomyces sp. NPDC059166]|uniref:condensation domain-containing protein n=1 Tax=Streptomyces sp. NPDC059166 TaxID=3346752 RepID=UPI0036C30128